MSRGVDQPRPSDPPPEPGAPERRSRAARIVRGRPGGVTATAYPEGRGGRPAPTSTLATNGHQTITPGAPRRPRPPGRRVTAAPVDAAQATPESEVCGPAAWG